MASEGLAATITDSIFSDNIAHNTGGGLFWYEYQGGKTLEILRSQFVRNQADGIYDFGGAEAAGALDVRQYSTSNSEVRIEDSEFRSNTATASYHNVTGGVSSDMPNGRLLVTQSTFWDNEGQVNGGMHVWSGSAHVINSTFAGNRAIATPAAPPVSGGFGSLAIGVVIKNSVFAGNTGPFGNDLDQISGVLTSSVRTSCIEGLSSYSGFGNLESGSGPFVNGATGNLRLTKGATCIDAGNPFVDFDPYQSGFQLPPASDLGG